MYALCMIIIHHVYIKQLFSRLESVQFRLIERVTSHIGKVTTTVG